MNPLILSALISAAMAGYGAWQIQDWRYDAKEKHRVEKLLEKERKDSAQALAAQRELRILDNRRASALAAAQNAAAGRLAGLRRDSDGARVALVSLHDAAAQAMREAGASHQTCLATADSLRVVLGELGAAAHGLAEKADGHVSDIKTMSDAWPKE